MILRRRRPCALARPTGPVDDLPALPQAGLMRPAPLEGDDAWTPDRPLVSVVIPCFNYGRFVEEAVDSILAQTFTDLEVIVVEGGSTDADTRARVAALAKPRTRVLFQPQPSRVGANRNLGIANARGRYVCCLDADDKLQPTYIEKAVFLSEHYAYDVVSSAMRVFGESAEDVDILERPDIAAILHGNHVLTCALFRRSYWEASGGYEDLPANLRGHVHEDWRYWVRLAALGARFCNMAHDHLLLYRKHGASLSTGDDVLELAEQRRHVRELNADVLDQQAVLRSARRAAANLRRLPVLDMRRELAAKGPTVLIAAPWLVLGGAERLLSAIVAHLVRAGWRVLIVTSIEPNVEQGDTEAWFTPHTPEIYHLPKFLDRSRWSDFLRYLIQSRGVELLWIVGSALAYDNLQALRTEFPRLRVADLLFNTVGHVENNRRRRGEIDLNLVENQEVRSWLLAQGEEPERVVLIESGVALDVLRPRERCPEVLRRMGARDGDLLVGFAGRWSVEKAPLAFLKIAASVARHLPIRFVMTGAGPLRPDVERLRDELGLSDRVLLAGEVDDIASWVGSLDLLVLPSQLDGRPVVVMEALALGVPVLASRVGALPELIAEGQTGWICDVGDTRAFAARIETLAASPDLRAALRKNARAYAEANLDAAVMLEAYERTLRGLATTQASEMDRP